MTNTEMRTEDPFKDMDPFPVSPEITEEIIKEIGNIKCEVLGPGVVVFRNAFNIDQSLILNYIDSKAEEAHKIRWTYHQIDGVTYGINEDGFRYRMEEVPSTPIRLLDPVNSTTPESVKNFFLYLEDQIYKCLLKYIDNYPLMIGSIWWKTRGHILRYGDGGRLGCHADNDTNYKVTKGVRYMPRGMVASRQTCGALIYMNDCVDTEEELNGKNFTGGNLRFVHLGISYKPQKGDIIFFPTNYVASHDVETMGKGVRYSYLTFFGQGADDIKAGIVVVEENKSKQWCPPVWFDNIYDDYEKYCKSEYSIYSDVQGNGVEPGWNPVFQGREVAQYGTTHDSVEIGSMPDPDTSELLPTKNDQDKEDIMGPCGTEPQKIGE
jgi:hypothetical protein